MAGLDKSLKVIIDMMMPNVNPDVVIESSVMLDEDYDPCKDRVSNWFLPCFFFNEICHPLGGPSVQGIQTARAILPLLYV